MGLREILALGSTHGGGVAGRSGLGYSRKFAKIFQNVGGGIAYFTHFRVEQVFYSINRVPT
jgi:hypothetical protein